MPYRSGRHFLQIPGVGRPEEDVIEGYTGLGFAAGVTCPAAEFP